MPGNGRLSEDHIRKRPLIASKLVRRFSLVEDGKVFEIAKELRLEVNRR